MGKIIAITLLTLISLVFIVVFSMDVLGYINWLEQQHGYKTAPKISFKTFLNFYQIAPEKWELGEDYVYYLRKVQKDYPLFSTPFYYELKDIVIFKTFHDFKLYIKWRKALNKQEINRQQMQNTAKFIKEVQKDINDYEDEVREWVQENVDKTDEHQEGMIDATLLF